MLNTVGSGLTRRNFLKASAIAAGGAWAGSLVTTAKADETPMIEGMEGTAVADTDEIFHSCCRPNCFNACKLKVHVREGKVVKVGPGEQPIETNKRICLRGLTHVESIYHPDRVLHPLRRVDGTERGAGQWEEVTWDEALTEIATKIGQLRQDFGDSSIFRISCSGNYGAINGAYTNKLFNKINAGTVSSSLDMGNFYSIMRVFGMAGLWPANDPRDLVNAKNIFLWGNNITDAQLHDWHYLADAKEAGAKVICIDPVFTQVAAKSDMFVPIKPGTDTALELGMMYTILDEDLQDGTFILEHTCAPFLVDAATGLFMRSAALTGNEEDADYVVWDSDTQAATALAEAKNPAVEWSGEALPGIEANTAFTLLKAEIMQWDPETASAVCDVPADTIRELARLACDGPVTHRCGWGAQAYDNGLHPYHAGATMAALAGQLGFPGANYATANWTYFANANPTLDAVDTELTSPTIASTYFPDVVMAQSYLGAPISPKALWIFCGNPLCTWVDTNAWLNDVLPQMELVVTCDSMMTDTARYSDFVLPVAHWFEYEDIVVQGNYYSLIHSEKVVEPLGEALPDSQIVQLLAKKMGYDDLFLPESEWLRSYLDAPGNAEAGLTYDNLVQQEVLRYMPDPFLLWQGGNFYTPSGRVEFYVENPTVYGVSPKMLEADLERERLPHYFPPREAITDDNAEFPFQLMSERPRYRVHGQFAYNKILRELDPEPTVKMNPADAETTGLAEGDYVECYNNHGHVVAKLVTSEAIRPRVIRYAKSWQMDQHKAGGFSEPLSRETDAVLVNQSFMDCAVNVRKWEE